MNSTPIPEPRTFVASRKRSNTHLKEVFPHPPLGSDRILRSKSQFIPTNPMVSHELSPPSQNTPSQVISDPACLSRFSIPQSSSEATSSDPLVHSPDFSQQPNLSNAIPTSPPVPLQGLTHPISSSPSTRPKRPSFAYDSYVAAATPIAVFEFNQRPKPRPKTVARTLVDRFPGSNAQSWVKKFYDWPELRDLLPPIGTGSNTSIATRRAHPTLLKPKSGHPSDFLLIDLPLDRFGDLLLRFPTRQYLPKVAVNQFRTCFVFLWQQLSTCMTTVSTHTEQHSIQTLKKIMLLPTLFNCPWYKSKAPFYDALQSSILADDWSHFYINSYFRPNLTPTIPASPSVVDPAVSRSEALLSSGYIHRAFVALGGTSSVDITIDKQSRLRDLHPPRLSLRLDNDAGSAAPPSIVLEESKIFSLIKSLPRMKAPGFTGLRSEHLQQCLGTGQSTDELSFLKAITSFLSLIVNCQLPRPFMHLLGCGILIALPKSPLDLDDIRPISMIDLSVNLRV